MEKDASKDDQLISLIFTSSKSTSLVYLYKIKVYSFQEIIEDNCETN